MCWSYISWDYPSLPKEQILPHPFLTHYRFLSILVVVYLGALSPYLQIPQDTDPHILKAMSSQGTFSAGTWKISIHFPFIWKAKMGREPNKQLFSADQKVKFTCSTIWCLFIPIPGPCGSWLGFGWTLTTPGRGAIHLHLLGLAKGLELRPKANSRFPRAQERLSEHFWPRIGCG